MSEFEPDQFTLDMLGSEHRQFEWIGPRLLAVASRIRNSGGSKQDFTVWVKASYLWQSYQGCTRDSAAAQGRSLEGAWRASADSKPFDLEVALADLEDRATRARWTGRSGSRNRAVALAFIGFCRDRNCFTRTISSYELSKYTAGMSPMTVGRALADLVEVGLLSKVDRTDKRVSSRSTSRYQLNLYWKPERLGAAPGLPSLNSGTDAMSTCKYSLPQIRRNRDLWSFRGLGQTAGRVYEALADEPATVGELSARAGLSDQSTRRAVAKLADNCLAGVLPGRPVRYFKVETPLSAVEEMLGCTGYVESVIAKTTQRQAANRAGYPANYSRPQIDSHGHPPW